MSLYLKDPDVELHCGDALEVLRELPDRSVHMCATSPPFYGLRDYGTGTWEGGAECDHMRNVVPHALDDPGIRRSTLEGGKKTTTAQAEASVYRDVCGKCGARRIDNQIGLEESPAEWVARLVEVFREVRRVLRDDGTLWVEIGDSYENKQPLGQPWLLAFALRADGWYLRSEIIWARPNPMPESVTDRPTKAHSTVFLLSKSPRYFYDQEAIREAFSENTHSKGRGVGVKQEFESQSGGLTAGRNNGSFNNAIQRPASESRSGANARSVWTINEERTEHESQAEVALLVDGQLVARLPVPAGEALSRLRAHGESPDSPQSLVRDVWQIATEPTPFAHFATWPQKLVQRMILAGTSERGVCPECGAPWVREVATSYERGGGTSGFRKDAREPLGRQNGTGMAGKPKMTRSDKTIGWITSCRHDDPAVPATILDPFAGSVDPNALEYGDDAARMRDVREGSESAQGSTLLLDQVREQGAASQASAAEQNDEGLHSAPAPWASDGDQAGIRDGASTDHVGDARKEPVAGRSGASQERKERRQPPGELGADAQAVARPDAETTSDSELSSLRGASGDLATEDRGSQGDAYPRAVPAVVLDPFAGSGTTLLVARKLGRKSIGIELNPDYCALASERLAQQSLFATEVA